MRAPRNQNTLRSACSVSGRGYWTGQANTLTFHPAEPDTGVVFVRDDLPGKPRARAIADNRVSMGLRTRLSRGAAEFDMIEHVMAALFGAQIDNVYVHCSASEMPGFDGSCLPVSLALDAAGQLPQIPKVQQVVIEEILQVGDADCFVRAEPAVTDSLEVEYRLNYGTDSVIGVKTFEKALSAESFLEEIAPARTFVTEQEAAWLQSQGLGKHVTNRDLLVFGENGPIDNQLRFDDECARHKALDVVGDLALVGADLVGRIVASKSGHQLNGDLAALIRNTYMPELSGSGKNAA